MKNVALKKINLAEIEQIFEIVEKNARRGEEEDRAKGYEPTMILETIKIISEGKEVISKKGYYCSLYTTKRLLKKRGYKVTKTQGVGRGEDGSAITKIYIKEPKEEKFKGDFKKETQKIDINQIEEIIKGHSEEGAILRKIEIRHFKDSLMCKTVRVNNTKALFDALKDSFDIGKILAKTNSFTVFINGKK